MRPTDRYCLRAMYLAAPCPLTYARRDDPEPWVGHGCDSQLKYPTYLRKQH